MAAAWFDVFLDGNFLFQIRLLLLPCVFFGVFQGVSSFGMLFQGVSSFGMLFQGLSLFVLRCAFSCSRRDFSCRRMSAVCFLVQSDIRPFNIGWVTGGSLWIAAAMRSAVVRAVDGVVSSCILLMVVVWEWVVWYVCSGKRIAFLAKFCSMVSKFSLLVVSLSSGCWPWRSQYCCWCSCRMVE